MSRHSFDPGIARAVGLNAAVIYQNIRFWCERNAVKNRNVHDGNVWTYNTVKEFGVLFPYLTPKQIRLALERLEESALLVSGNFNEDLRDRTKWYALAEGTVAFAELVNMHLPKRAETIAPEGKPLPDSKPDNKHTPKPPEGADDLFSANGEADQQNETAEPIEEGFQTFWESIWPKHQRKTGKADCLKVYRAACTGLHPKAEKISPDELNRCAAAYIASVRDPQYLKGTLPWLRQPGWEPFMEAPSGAEYREEDLTPSRRSMLQDGICPPSMKDSDGRPNAEASYWLKRYGYGGKA
ncbi:hypothetical protein [Leisingera sp. M523]|uniref:hypothetical protein n=1 Tax=Leisingera sp. M523 TaxID=2867013 RepID=UPI0021A56BC5|nr:hypothetical protein [Leisingera sp. M523]UWQ30231.1 hypothetical protein K3557_06760 [Leisingera sp. M523]